MNKSVVKIFERSLLLKKLSIKVYIKTNLEQFWATLNEIINSRKYKKVIRNREDAANMDTLREKPNKK